MNKVSLKDIAKDAGVSITTVSLVINNKSKKGRISDAVVERVKAVIKKHNYQPNIIARSLRTGKSTTIGLILEDVSNNFFGTIYKTIEQTAYKSGYKLISASTDNDGQRALDLIEMMEHQQVEGLIITPTLSCKPIIEQLIKSNKPLVLFDRYFPGLNSNYVVLDNLKGAFEMTNHLIQKGYKNIAFITITSPMNQMQNRLKGYKKALKDFTKKEFPSYVLEFPYESTNEDKILLLDQFLKQNPKVDALFFGTNYLGILGIEYIRSKKLKVPGDYGLVSFDDHDLFKLMEPGISVVAQPIQLLANESIKALLHLIQGEGSQLIQKNISPSLIFRKSV